MTLPLLIHITTPPTPDCEALEYALAMAAFDLDVRVLFSGRGKLWLTPTQSPRREGGKNPTKLLAALAMYGIEEAGFTGELTTGNGVANIVRVTDVADWMNGRQVVSF